MQINAVRLWCGLVLSLVGFCNSSTTLAQVQRSGGANAQLAAQYQQAIAERAQLQADNEKLKKQLEDAKKQTDAATKQLATLKASAATAVSQLAAAQATGQSSAQSLEQTKSRMQELLGRFRDTAATLRIVEAERTQLQQQLAESKSKYDVCAERNYQLFQVDSEVLDKYEHESPFSRAARAEPFTRIKRTQIENFVDEYRERAEELRLQKAGVSVPASSSGRPTPAPSAMPATEPAPTH